MRILITLITSLIFAVSSMGLSESDVLGQERSVSTDWADFHGPLGNGTSAERGLRREWPVNGPEVLWRVPVKPGWSSPVVVDNDLYICSTEEPRGTAETITCLNAATGQQRWTLTYDVGPYWEKNIGWARGGFRSTPCVWKDRIYTIGAIGHFHCCDRHTGKVLWKRNLWDTFNPSGEKGYSFSPMIADGKLLLWYGDGASDASRGIDADRETAGFDIIFQSLDPLTGNVIWTFREPHRRPARMGEGQTPSITEFAGEPCAVISANCELKALRIRDGREVWKFPVARPDARGTTIPSPLVLDRQILNVADNDGTSLVTLDRKSPETPAQIHWKKNLETYCAVHQFRHHNGYLYGFTGEIRGADEQVASESMLNLTCLDLATGQVVWSEPGYRAGVAMTLADGLLFVRSYQRLRLIEASPKGCHVRGDVKTHDVWKPTLNLLDFVQPVLSKGRLFVRTPAELICYQVAN